MKDTDKNPKEVTLEEVKRAAAGVQESQAKTGERLQLVVFKLGGEEYALPIDHIKEVVITPGIARIPQTPPYIKGVANIRGNIIAIMDLEQRFHLLSEADHEGQRGNYTLVIESSTFKAGILVTQVPNTLTTYASEIDDTSGIMKYSSLDQECIKGVVKAHDRLIMLIDIFQLMEQETLREISNL